MMPLKCDMCLLHGEGDLVVEGKVRFGGQSLCVLCGQFSARGITTP